MLFSPQGRVQPLERSLCTQTNTQACVLPHSVLRVNWQVDARTLWCVCVLTPLASEHLLPIRVAHRHFIEETEGEERVTERRFGLQISFDETSEELQT